MTGCQRPEPALRSVPASLKGTLLLYFVGLRGGEENTCQKNLLEEFNFGVFFLFVCVILFFW